MWANNKNEQITLFLYGGTAFDRGEVAKVYPSM